ncbi:MAG: NusA-like transcription termination signal-binding factor [Candidatus Altiarchaeota archaeon]
MEKIKLDANEIKYITLFESLTGAKVKDCVTEKNALGFLIEQGYMGLAIGKNGSNVSKVMKLTGRNIFVMEASDDLKKFLDNLFQPLKIRNSRIFEDGKEKVAILELNKKDRSKAIGQDGVRIKIAKKLAERHFGLNDIKIKTV